VLAVGLASTVVVGVAYWTGAFNRLELQTVDLRFSLRGSEGPPKNVAIVGVDDATFNDLRQRWPFNRTLHAKVIDRICAGHPRAIAMDIQFSELTSVAADNALGQAIFNCNGRVALATTEVGPHGEPGLVFAKSALDVFNAKAGNSNFSTDSADVIRQMPYELGGLKSFALGAAELATGKTITKSDMGGSSQWIDFAGPPGTVTSYSYARVLPMRVVHAGGTKPWKVVAFGAVPGIYVTSARTKAAAEAALTRFQVPSSAFRDKVVVVGALASSLDDIHPTSTGPLMPGPELQANAIETAIKGFPLRSIGTVWDVVLIVCLGFVVPLTSLRMRPLFAVCIGLVFAAIFVPGVLILAFHEGEIVSFVYPMAALAISVAGLLVVRYALASADLGFRVVEPIGVALGSEVAGYRVERLLGRGGGGTVYLATDVALRRKVALKVLNPELSNSESSRARFLRESQLAASLDHPNVMPILRAGEEGSHLYIAMKLVRGSLATLLRRNEPLELPRAIHIVEQVAAALDAIHAIGLVHRDVTPSNILLDSLAGASDHVYLADFGLSKHRGLVSGTGLVGKPDYVAPEQIRGDAVDGRADQYSLACVLYECITGEPPFAAASEITVIGSHLSREPEPVTTRRPDAPAGLAKPIARALAKTPEERFASCAEFVAAVREAAELAAPDPVSAA
jgi:serine/threonine-protein kinase